MILAAALLLLTQDVPANQAVGAPVEDDAPIIVRATYGRTTMLFDKGADGKLRNCRVMISSGSQRRDTTACQATPVCYAKTADDVTDCRELSVLDQAAAIGAPGAASAAPSAGKTNVFELPKLVQPQVALPTSGIGPSALTEDSRETERQRVKKISPPVNPASDGPVVRFTTGNEQHPDDTDKSEKRP